MATQTQERRLAFLATALPPIVWVVVFFLVPLAIVWAYSFGQNAGLTEVDVTGTFANYCARARAALSRHLRQIDLRGRADDVALSDHRLSGGARHRLCQRALAAMAAAADHAAVLDQSADPHLRADRGVAHRGLRQFHAGMALEQCELVHDPGGPTAPRRVRAAAAALQQFRRGASVSSMCTCRSWCCRSMPRSTGSTSR